MRILLAALLAAVAMFVWEFAAHMCTPLGEVGISYLPNESTVSTALASSIGHQCGLYAFPTVGLTKESSGGSPLCGTRPLACVNCSPAAAALWR
jgi:hypothetical protein